jgi:large subunit ribosomal protein L15
MGKLQPGDIKAKRPAPAEESDRALRVDRCHYRGACPNGDLPTYLKKEYAIVNIRDLNNFEDGSEINPEVLQNAGLINSIKDGVKILGDGELEKKLTVRVHKISRQAEEKITARGGRVEVI